VSGLVPGIIIMINPCINCGEKTWVNGSSGVEYCYICGFISHRGKDGNLLAHRESGERWDFIPRGCLFIFKEVL
jgi:hypothetical protein